jgi:hypothetical protein
MRVGSSSQLFNWKIEAVHLNMPNESRRDLLRKLACIPATASLAHLAVIEGLASSKGLERALVAIKLTTTETGNDPLLATAPNGLPLRAAPRNKQVLNSALAELHDYFLAGSLVVVNTVSDDDPENSGYAPEGFRLPAWAARMGGANLRYLVPDAFTFSSGLCMFAPGASMPKGPRRDHPTLSVSPGLIMPRANKGRMRAGSAGIPAFDGPLAMRRLGKQLAEVAGLLAVCGRLGISRPVFQVSLSGIGSHESTQVARLRELSVSVSAFFEHTRRVGLDRVVTVYTDHGLASDVAGVRRAQFAIGGSVLGGQIHGTPEGPPIARVQFEATLAFWQGYGYSELLTAFPELPGYSPPTLNFLA